MSFLAATAGRAVALIASVIKTIQAEYLATTQTVADTTPSVLRQAVWLLLTIAIVALLALLYWLLPDDLKAKDAEGVRNYGLIVAGLVGLPFAFWRSAIAARQADTAINQAETANVQAQAANKQAQIAERGQVTDRFTKAIEQLGKSGKDDEPNLPIRLGAIYSLELVSHDSSAYAQVVFDVLGEYVRLVQTETWCEPPDLELPLEYQDTTMPLRADVRAILSVWARYGDKTEVRLDLSRASFKRAMLDGFVFERADLTGTDFRECSLNGTSFAHATIMETEFDRSLGSKVNFGSIKGLRGSFTSAVCVESDFSYAELYGFDFTDAVLDRSSLVGIKTQGDGHLNVIPISKVHRLSLSHVDVAGANLLGWDGWESVRHKGRIENLTQVAEPPDDEDFLGNNGQ